MKFASPLAVALSLLATSAMAQDHGWGGHGQGGGHGPGGGGRPPPSAPRSAPPQARPSAQPLAPAPHASQALPPTTGWPRGGPPGAWRAQPSVTAPAPDWRGGAHNGRDGQRGANPDWRGGSQPGWQGHEEGPGGNWRGVAHGQWGYHGAWHETYRAPPFYYPRGWGYHRWAVGEYLPPFFFGSEYFLASYYTYGLPPPPWGCRWVRFGPDALLIDLRTGAVLETAYGVFYW